MASTRLPGKPLALIDGVPMIVHVWRRAIESGVGRVLVACAETAICEAIEAAGGEAILTDPALPSGSDRIKAAMDIVDPDRSHSLIVNLQGDLPLLAPSAIQSVIQPLLTDNDIAISTLAAEIIDEHEKANPNVVKVVMALQPGARQTRALYFTRATAPTGEGPLYHHIGIYAYRRPALEQFVKIPPSILEKRERLEQLRALEAGMRVDVVKVDVVPLGVDTPEDLQKAQTLMAALKEKKLN